MEDASAVETRSDNRIWRPRSWAQECGLAGPTPEQAWPERIVERHHRYEVNKQPAAAIAGSGPEDYRAFRRRRAGGSGRGPDHPWFVACQFHPEFTSTPRDGHPLFSGFVKAALEHAAKKA
ncbi:glutamine amidotransferase-related protein [Stutzerimonas xanthomarina]|uniref:glutamine amidotransferase-related protein n=1 Tax=Stutzerimonas xanthomarina TaxID=271420 RepID=UPI003AA95E9F